MSTWACKLITNEGEFFLAFNSTVNQFVSPPFSTPVELGKYAAKEWKELSADWRKSARTTKDVYRMTKDERHRGTYLLAKMKRGEPLTDDEACEVYEFWRFLRATVADHQHDYKGTSQKVVDGWIAELGMRDQFPENWDYWDILDHASWESFQKTHHFRAYPDAPRLDDGTTRSTPEQCAKLVGRYVSVLAMIARIAGPKKRTPVEIVNAFLE